MRQHAPQHPTGKPSPTLTPRTKSARARMAAWVVAGCWALGAAAVQAQILAAPERQFTGVSAATAHSPCPAHGDSPGFIGDEAIRQRLNQLEAAEAACENHAPYHAHRGLLLLQAGWLSEAATALEKSLLIQPEQPGVQLDYAQVLALIGQKASARELVSSVAARQDIQPDLRQWLRTGLLPDASTWSWAGTLQTSLGHESNLASATYTDSLTLYLSNGSVQVPLADSEKPRPGLGLKSMAAVQGLRTLGPGDLRVLLSVQSRQAEGMSSNHLTEALLGYAWPLGPGTATAQVAEHRFIQVGQSAYADTALRLKYEPLATLAGCKWSPVVGRVDQRYLSSANMSGTYAHAGLEALCASRAGGLVAGGAETTFSLTDGQDTPEQANRPGGQKRRQELSLRHDRTLALPMPQGHELPGLFKVWLRHSLSQDRDIYSPLLGDMKARTRRQDWGWGYWWALAPQWSAGFDLETTSQKSSNTLLNIKNSAFYLGLRWASKS